MKLKVGYNRLNTCILGFFIQLILTLISITEFKEIGDKWELYAGIISIFVFVYGMFVWWKFKLKFLSPSFLFFIASYLLHLALIILVAFNLREYKVKNNIVLYSYSEEDAPFAILYCCWFLFMYVSSYMLLKKKKINFDKAKPRQEIYNKKEIQLIQARNAGRILFFISAPAMLYNNITLMKIRMTISYHDIYNVNPSFYGIPLGPFINLFLPSLFFLLYSYKNDKKRFTLISTFIAIYYGIYMVLTGAKIAAIVTILAIMVMYNYYFGLKLTLKNVILSYLAIKALVAVTSMRSDIGLAVEGNIIQQFMDGFINDDPIIELLNELGGTILTPTLVMYAVREGGGYLWGKSYLFGPLGSILEGMRITDYFSNQANMVVYLTDPARGAYINSKTYAMGGSAIGEWYLNFGWIGIILVPIFVIAIIKFEEVIFRDKNNPLSEVMAYCFLISLIMYSRQYITDMFWILFYRYTVCFFLTEIIMKSKRNNVVKG